MLHGISQTQIARELDVRDSTVSMFLSGQTTSRRLYLYFVMELGVPPKYFGQKYKEEEAA